MSKLANFKVIDFNQAMEVYQNQLKGVWRDDPRGRWPQIEDLMHFLEERTTFLREPASTKYHLCCENGLFIHSVTVAQLALRVAEVVCPWYPKSSVALCAFCHDFGKLGSFVTENGRLFQIARYEKNLLKDGSQSEAQPYKYNDQLMQMSGGVRSLRLVEKFIDLTEAEAQAILAHDGQYVDANKEYAQQETPLLLLTHFVDMWTGRVIEGDLKGDYHNTGVFSIP